MNSRQFSQLIDNRRRASPALVLDGRPGAAILRRAARDLRSRGIADEAWQRVASSEWLSCTRVRSLCEGLLEIEVRREDCRAELQRRVAPLFRRLRGLVPNLRRVRFVSPQAQEAGAHDHA